MPDGNWWLAQNVKLASYGGTPVGTIVSNCNKDECGLIYTLNEMRAAWGGNSGEGDNIQRVYVLPVGFYLCL
jgi:hypothetical protein